MLTYTRSFFFFFNDTATTEIYTLSLHDALPISLMMHAIANCGSRIADYCSVARSAQRLRQYLIVHSLRSSNRKPGRRSEEHTSELQSPCNLVCRLLLEKKKKIHNTAAHRVQPVL